MDIKGRKVKNMVAASSSYTCLVWVFEKLFSSLFSGLDVVNFHCYVCELAKSHQVSFSPSLNKSSTSFMLVHFDASGPFKDTICSARWLVTFIDDCTRMTWVHLMKLKSEVNLLFSEVP